MRADLDFLLEAVIDEKPLDGAGAGKAPAQPVPCALDLTLIEDLKQTVTPETLPVRQ